MAKQKLNSLWIQKAVQVGRYADGNGLYLQIARGGSKSWLFRYSIAGMARQMGLGSAILVSLSKARAQAIECKQILLNGKDPLIERQMSRLQLQPALQDHIFSKCAVEYIEGHSSEWSNKKHKNQWISTLETYAFPVLGDVHVQHVNTELILKVLTPLWSTKTETATRLRGRLEQIIDWATAQDLRQGENPARWRGHLDKILPKPSRIKPLRHHAAHPFTDIGNLVARLREEKSLSAFALEFLILTSARTGEVLGAKWSEINFEESTWTIPSARMKGKREHRVPLCSRGVEILAQMKAVSSDQYVFEGRNPGRPLSNMALLQQLRRMNIEAVTHGFRSTFRDWAAECTNFPNEVIEMALAHSIRNKVEAAYRRGDLLLKRRALMHQWSKFVNTPNSLKNAAVLSIDLLNKTDVEAIHS